MRYRQPSPGMRLSSPAMLLDATCHITYHSNAPIPAIMMLRPRSGYAQWIPAKNTSSSPTSP